MLGIVGGGKSELLKHYHELHASINRNVKFHRKPVS